MASSPPSPWADLPNDLLSLVLNKLESLPDYIRFGAVCKSWLHVAGDAKQERKESCQRNLPMLLIPTDDDVDKDHRNLYSISENKVYSCKLRTPRTGRPCNYGGWWAIPEEDLSITLLNLFTRNCIRLPPLSGLPRYLAQVYRKRDEIDLKIILSCDPLLRPHDYVVAITYSSFKAVAFIRSGEESWHYVIFIDAEDIIFANGRIYAVNSESHLVAIDYSRILSNCSGNCERDPHYSDSEIQDIFMVHHYVGYSDSEIECIIDGSDDTNDYDFNLYLAESSSNGDLLLVRRIFWAGLINKGTDTFQVYKLKMFDDEQRQGEWVQIYSLPEDSSRLFLSDSYSSCLSIRGFPNCLANLIYFVHDYPKYIENGSFEGFCPLSLSQVRKRLPAAWIHPPLL